MNQTDIETAIYSYVASLNDIPPVYYPNVSNADLPNPPQADHIRLFILPAASVSYGLSGVDQYRGIVQFSIYTREGGGTVSAAIIADTIADHFPRGTVLQQNQTKVRFDRAADLAPPVTNDGWHTLHLSIYYEVTL